MIPASSNGSRFQSKITLICTNQCDVGKIGNITRAMISVPLPFETHNSSQSLTNR